MKTTVKFKALQSTRVRNAEGKKVKVGKDKTFITTETFAKVYRGYKRLFQEVEVIVSTKPKLDKTTVKNTNAFPVTISDDMTNAQVEKILSEMGAKFTKKSSRAKLLEAYAKRTAELEEDKVADKIEKATEVFKKMVDTRTIDQLEEIIESDTFYTEINEKDGIEIEFAKDYVEKAHEKAVEEATKKTEGDEDGNSEGSLDGADAGDTNDGNDEGNEGGDK